MTQQQNPQRSDPRDIEFLSHQSNTDSKKTPDKSNSAESGDQSPLPAEKPKKQFKTSFGQEPVKPVTPPKTWVFDERDDLEWHMGGNSFDQETPIGHAWSRLQRRGINVGYPLTDMVLHTSKRKVQGVERDVDTYVQGFQHATAKFVDDPDLNPNSMVEFSDARGIVGTDSGV